MRALARGIVKRGHSPKRECANFVAASSIRILPLAARCTLSPMARAKRGFISAGIYHVTHLTAGRIDMFRDDVDRTDFCVRLARVIRKQEWVCHSFVLMPTHYHLLLAVEDNMLQPGMQRLNGTYAQAFNRRWGRWGHLRGDRYGAKPVESDGHFLACVRYIARNPVEAGICVSAADWTWSSYPDCVGLRSTFAFVEHETVRGYFGGESSRSLQLIRDFVEDLERGSVPRRAA
jgi:putative transposase